MGTTTRATSPTCCVAPKPAPRLVKATSRRRQWSTEDFLDDNGLSPVEGAFAFLRTVEDIDAILVGVTGVKELEENILAFTVKLPPSLDFSPFAIGNEEMIKPQQWKLL